MSGVVASSSSGLLMDTNPPHTIARVKLYNQIKKMLQFSHEKEGEIRPEEMQQSNSDKSGTGRRLSFASEGVPTSTFL